MDAKEAPPWTRLSKANISNFELTFCTPVGFSSWKIIDLARSKETFELCVCVKLDIRLDRRKSSSWLISNDEHVHFGKTMKESDGRR